MVPWSMMRAALQRPALPFAAFLTLALGIGLAGTIFGFTYGTVLVDLPFEGRWVVVERLVNGDDTDGRVNAEDLHSWRAEAHTIDPLFGYQTLEASIGDDAGPAERIAGARLETAGLRAMNVTPVLGRGFSDEEGRVGGPDVGGRAIRVDGVPRQVASADGRTRLAVRRFNGCGTSTSKCTDRRKSGSNCAAKITRSPAVRWCG